MALHSRPNRCGINPSRTDITFRYFIESSQFFQIELHKLSGTIVNKKYSAHCFDIVRDWQNRARGMGCPELTASHSNWLWGRQDLFSQIVTANLGLMACPEVSQTPSAARCARKQTNQKPNHAPLLDARSRLGSPSAIANNTQ